MTFKNLDFQLLECINNIRPDLLINNELYIRRDLSFIHGGKKEGFRTVSISIGDFTGSDVCDKVILDRILNLIYSHYSIDYRSYLTCLPQSFLSNFVNDKLSCRLEPWNLSNGRTNTDNVPEYDDIYNDIDKIQKKLNEIYKMSFFPNYYFKEDGFPYLELDMDNNKLRMYVWLQLKNDYLRELRESHLPEGLKNFIAFSIILAIQQADIHPIGLKHSSRNNRSSKGGIVLIDQYNQNMDSIQESTALELLLYFSKYGRINQYIVALQDFPIIPSFDKYQDRIPYVWLNRQCPYCGKASNQGLENYCSYCNAVQNCNFKIRCPICHTVLENISKSHVCKNNKVISFNRLVEMAQNFQNLGLRCEKCGKPLLFTQKECCDMKVNNDLVWGD
jgi:hypothetical protein